MTTAAIPMRRRDWMVPVLLMLLSLVPSVAGSVRVAELARGGPITVSNARFFAMPIPVLLHIVAAIPFGMVGAWLFSDGFRRAMPRWHRAAGRVLVPLGLLAASSGLWMTVTYPWPAGDGVVVYWLRLLFGTAMLLAMVAGIRAVLRRDFVAHGDWMTRAYAIGMGAGTQVFTHLPWFILVGQPMEGPRAVMMGAGWMINVMVAEWVIRGRGEG